MFMSRFDAALLLTVRVCAILVLGVPLVFSADTFYPFIVGKTVYSRTLIEIAFAAWVVMAVRNPGYRPKLSLLLAALAAFGMISVVTAVTGVDPLRSFWSTYERMYGVVDLLHWMAYAVVLAAVFQTERDWLRIFHLMLVVSVVMAVLQFMSVTGLPLPMFGFPGEGPRMQGTLGNAMYVGAFGLVHSLIALALLAHSFQISGDRAPKPRSVSRPSLRPGWLLAKTALDGAWSLVATAMWRRRLFWVLATMLNLWMMYGSGTRSSYLGLIAALLFLAIGYLLWGKARSVKIILLATLTALALTGGFFIVGGGTPPAQYLAERNAFAARLVLANQWRDDGSIGGRLSGVSIGLQGFAERPILGWGQGNYSVVWGRFYDEGRYGVPDNHLDSSHNTVVDVMVAKGIGGLICYLAVWGLAFRVIVVKLRRKGINQAPLAFIVGAAAFALLVQNMAVFDTASTLLMFSVIIAFAVGMEPTLRIPFASGSLRLGRAVSGLAAGYQSIPSVLRTVPGWLGVILLSCCLLATVYSLNVRTYLAADAIRDGVEVSSVRWRESVSEFELAGDRFPPLDHDARMMLVFTLTHNLSARGNVDDARAAMSVVDRNAGHLAERHAAQWFTLYNLAAAHQRVHRFGSSLGSADRYLSQAEALAPGVSTVLRLRERQTRLEEDSDAR